MNQGKQFPSNMEITYFIRLTANFPSCIHRTMITPSPGLVIVQKTFIKKMAVRRMRYHHDHDIYVFAQSPNVLMWTTNFV